jgi:hypothetical protein
VRLTCPTVFSGKVNTGALTTLEPVEATADPAELSAGAAARPTPKAATAVSVTKREWTKGTFNVDLLGNDIALRSSLRLTTTPSRR